MGYHKHLGGCYSAVGGEYPMRLCANGESLAARRMRHHEENQRAQSRQIRDEADHAFRLMQLNKPLYPFLSQEKLSEGKLLEYWNAWKNSEPAYEGPLDKGLRKSAFANSHRKCLSTVALYPIS